MSNELPLSKYVNHCSPLVFGCMGLGGDWDTPHYDVAHVRQAHSAIDAALEAGIRVFDHADIYTRGKAESVFGEVLAARPELREQITIQSKCGIRFADESAPGRYDFSESWIVSSVENSLKRLGIENLDVLLLHRPDPLMAQEEVAAAFDKLKSSGKVSHFGVSNMSAPQIALLEAGTGQKLVCNQLELSLNHLGVIDQSVIGNVAGEANYNLAAGTIEHCQLNDIQVQSWGSLGQGLFSGRDLAGQAEHIIATATLVANLAEQYQVSKEAIVLAFLLRLPFNVQPVIGTVSPERIRACQQAVDVSLSREHWYQLFVTARGRALP